MLSNSCQFFLVQVKRVKIDKNAAVNQYYIDDGETNVDEIIIQNSEVLNTVRGAKIQRLQRSFIKSVDEMTLRSKQKTMKTSNSFLLWISIAIIFCICIWFLGGIFAALADALDLSLDFYNIVIFGVIQIIFGFLALCYQRKWMYQIFGIVTYSSIYSLLSVIIITVLSMSHMME